MQQICDSSFRFGLLVEELQKIRPAVDASTFSALRLQFWEILQDSLEAMVSEHLNIWQSNCSGEKHMDGSLQNGRKQLFSFNNTGFSATASSSMLKKVRFSG